MRIIINNQSMVPIYEQLVNQLKDMILNGALSDEEALPSVRSMSADLKISSLTVKKAYDLLEEEGFVTTVHGKGTFVNAADRQLATEARRRSAEDELSTAVKKARSAGMSDDEIRTMLDLILEENN